MNEKYKEQVRRALFVAFAAGYHHKVSLTGPTVEEVRDEFEKWERSTIGEMVIAILEKEY